MANVAVIGAQWGDEGKGKPDTNAHGLGEQPEPLYTVTFVASDLFDDATPGDEVRLDLWQSYLSPA